MGVIGHQGMSLEEGPRAEGGGSYLPRQQKQPPSKGEENHGVKRTCMGTSYTGTTPLKALESRRGREGGGEEGGSVNVPRGKDERSSKRGRKKESEWANG